MKILLAVVILFSTTVARAQQSDADPRMVRVEEWLKAILHHEPGEFDAAAERMASWSYADLQALSIDAVALSQLMRDLRLFYFTFRTPRQPKPQQIRFTPRQMDRLRLLACAAAGIVKEQPCVARKAPFLLTPADFEILDNGVAQQVDLVSFDQVPLNVVLVFDMSNSVEGDRRDRLLRTANKGTRTQTHTRTLCTLQRKCPTADKRAFFRAKLRAAGRLGQAQ